MGIKKLSTITSEIRSDFKWGKIVEIHNIGPYFIVEYKSRKFKNCAPTKYLEKESSFHPYFMTNKVKLQDTSHSFDTLEEAMFHAMANKHKAPQNTSTLMLKMIS